MNKLNDELFSAIEAQDYGKVQNAVEKGADIHAKNNQNQTPLDIAQEECPYCPNIIAFLKDKTANHGHSDVYRMTHSVNSTDPYTCIPQSSTNSGSRGIKQITEPVNLTTPSNQTQKNSHIRKRRDAQSIYSMPGYSNPDIDPRIPQLAHVQDGANPPQAIPNNTISSFNGTMLLVDVLTRKWTGQKPISVPSPDLSEDHQALSDILSIYHEFEKAMEDAAQKSGVPVDLSNIDFLKMHKEIAAKIANGKSNKIPEFLRLYAKDICIDGQVSSEKCEEFMTAFNEKLNMDSNQNLPESPLEKISISSGNIMQEL